MKGPCRLLDIWFCFVLRGSFLPEGLGQGDIESESKIGATDLPDSKPAGSEEPAAPETAAWGLEATVNSGTGRCGCQL